MPKIFRICIPHTFRDAFDYLAEGLHPGIGTRVWVPFRNSTRLGLVVGETFLEDCPHKLKPIASLIDQAPLLDEEMLRLCSWVSRYYQSPLSEVLPLALPKKYRLGQEERLPFIESYALVLSKEAAHNLLPARVKKQHALIDFLAAQPKAIAKKTLSEAGFTGKQIDVLRDLQIIQLQQEQSLPVPPCMNLMEPLPLNHEQSLALDCIAEKLQSYRCFLLQGVTGSGKTEVYLQAISKILALGKQVLILVPEIGLTPQLLARFVQRFKEPIALIHSKLNDSERQVAWQLAKTGIAKLIIGTRAAVFTPMPDLGMIVIDEEHDASLKQMEGVRYSARDTALVRAHNKNIPIILGTATPSLESMHNCLQGKYQLLRLNQKAMASSPLHYQLVDIRNQPLQEGLASSVLQTIQKHLEKDHQVLVFINRRGFSPVLLCHQCGWMADCEACDSHLTLHRNLGQLLCHHCGLIFPVYHRCKSCNSRELLPIGAGTQRIHDFLHQHFPDRQVLRIDRDAVNTKHGLEAHLDRIHRGEAQLIIGTQMLAKGHHFPRLTLVVVLDADTGFFNQDFRALESLGQLLTQVAGRAGRAQYPGEVLIQTHIPQHPLLNILISQGYDSFAKALSSSRKEAKLPPWHFLALIRAQAKNESSLLQCLHTIKNQLAREDILVMGPAPAPLARKAWQHRMQLLIKSSSRKTLQTTLTELRAWLTINTKLMNGVRWNIDVDPMDLL